MWSKFWENLRQANKVGLDWDKEKKNFFDSILTALHNEEFDATTLADLAEIFAGIDRDGNPQVFQELRHKFIKENFKFLIHDEAKLASLPQISKALFTDLDIRRIVTLNYDMELEWQTMTLASEQGGDRNVQWNKLPLQKDAGRLIRRMPGGETVASEMLLADQSNRIAEFGLRIPDFERHILHLHGRQDEPTSALVTRRDYREQYWKKSVHSLPMSEAHRVLFAGNPILFVGTAATEPDVMRTLEQFLSNNANRRRTSTFLLWNADKDSHLNDLRRFWYYRQYGVHLLYDNEISQFAKLGSRHRPQKLHDAQHRIEKSLSDLATASLATREIEKRSKSDFRDPQTKFERNGGDVTP